MRRLTFSQRGDSGHEQHCQETTQETDGHCWPSRMAYQARHESDTQQKEGQTWSQGKAQRPTF